MWLLVEPERSDDERGHQEAQNKIQDVANESRAQLHGVFRSQSVAEDAGYGTGQGERIEYRSSGGESANRAKI